MAVGFNRNKNEGCVLRVFEFDLSFVARAGLTLDAFATLGLLDFVRDFGGIEN